MTVVHAMRHPRCQHRSITIPQTFKKTITWHVILCWTGVWHGFWMWFCRWILCGLMCMILETILGTILCWILCGHHHHHHHHHHPLQEPHRGPHKNHTGTTPMTWMLGFCVKTIQNWIGFWSFFWKGWPPWRGLFWSIFVLFVSFKYKYIIEDC